MVSDSTESDAGNQPFDYEVTDLLVDAAIADVFPDPYGHINYQAFPRLFEHGQDVFMGVRGWGFDAIERELGLRSYVAGYDVAIKGEVAVGDRMRVGTAIGRIGNTGITYHQLMEKAGQAVAEYRMTVVLVDENGQPAPVPQILRLALESPKSEVDRHEAVIDESTFGTAPGWPEAGLSE